MVGQMRGGSFPLEESTYELSRVLPFAEALPLVGKGSGEVLKRLAVQDGAVLIDVGTGQVYGRRQLRPLKLFDWFDHMKKQWTCDDGEWQWPDWYKVLRWGTRHHSALAFSVAATQPGKQAKQPVAVITISSDGDIHVFYGMRPEPSLTYPQPVEK